MFNQNPETNPLLTALFPDEMISPAMRLSLAVGEYGDGFAIFETFAVGMLFEFRGKVYRLIGFSPDNDLFLAPHGLGHEDMGAVLHLRDLACYHMRYLGW